MSLSPFIETKISLLYNTYNSFNDTLDKTNTNNNINNTNNNINNYECKSKIIIRNNTFIR